MIRRTFFIATAAAAVMAMLITSVAWGQSAAPNAPISVETDKQPSTDQSKKPQQSGVPVIVPSVSPSADVSNPPAPPARQEQLPLGVAQPNLPPATHVTDTSPTGTTTSGNWVPQTIMALAFVLALIFAARLLFRRLTGWVPARAGGRADAMVEVLSRSSIGPKTSVIFLKINQRVVVAGQTPAGLNTLTEFDDPDQVAAILAQVEAARPHSVSRSFGSLLKKVDRGYEATDEGGDDQEHVVDRARDSMSGLLGRIRSLKKQNGGDA